MNLLTGVSFQKFLFFKNRRPLTRGRRISTAELQRTIVLFIKCRPVKHPHIWKNLQDSLEITSMRSK